MPTENERKWLLRLDCKEDLLDDAYDQRYIRQGYLGFAKGVSLRVRDTNSKYEMTFKQKVNNRVVEIETKIDKRDFEDLWSVAVNKLEKIRYMISTKHGLWEIDTFLDHNHETYIVVAEHEMPEGQLEPKSIPKIITNNLVYAVPLDDDRFASKRLADVKYARELYKEFK